MNNYSEDQDVQLVRQIKAKKDYYSILGVEKSSSTEEIKKAYRNLSLKVHPDQNKAPGSEEAFKKVSEAYSHLRNEESRRQYDLSRRAADYDFQTSHQQGRRWHDSSRRADEFDTSYQQWRMWYELSLRAYEFYTCYQRWRRWNDVSRRADEFQTSNPHQYHDVRTHTYNWKVEFDEPNRLISFYDSMAARLARFRNSFRRAGNADAAAGAHQDRNRAAGNAGAAAGAHKD